MRGEFSRFIFNSLGRLKQIVFVIWFREFSPHCKLGAPAATAATAVAAHTLRLLCRCDGLHSLLYQPVTITRVNTALRLPWRPAQPTMISLAHSDTVQSLHCGVE